MNTIKSTRFYNSGGKVYARMYWHELTPEQKTEAIKQMKFAGDKDETRYPKYDYFIDNSGSIYGWGPSN